MAAQAAAPRGILVGVRCVTQQCPWQCGDVTAVNTFSPVEAEVRLFPPTPCGPSGHVPVATGLPEVMEGHSNASPPHTSSPRPLSVFLISMEICMQSLKCVLRVPSSSRGYCTKLVSEAKAALYGVPNQGLGSLGSYAHGVTQNDCAGGWSLAPTEGLFPQSK